jgi:hypothetical protein
MTANLPAVTCDPGDILLSSELIRAVLNRLLLATEAEGLPNEKHGRCLFAVLGSWIFWASPLGKQRLPALSF